MRPENLTETQLDAMELPTSEDRFDQELARWFCIHGGPWSGTASELLAAVKTEAGLGNEWGPQSPRALYAHVESHMQILRCLGVDALLHNGFPRMVSLRSCQDEKPAAKPQSGTSGINRCDPPNEPAALAGEQKKDSTDSYQINPLTDAACHEEIIAAKSEVAPERSVNGIYADGNNFEGRIFESTGDALFAIVEMRLRVREPGLDLMSVIELVAGRTQEITRCCGVAVGLLQQESVTYPARTGVASTMGGLHFQASLFQSCQRTGRTLQLGDAQKHPGVGATCRQEGIGSLILLPILHNREVVGAMELLFKERRSFSAADVMDLELIAGVISESLSGAAPMELKQPEAREGLTKTKASENMESQAADTSKQTADLIHPQPRPFRQPRTSSFKHNAPESVVLDHLASRLRASPTLLWLTFKRAWTRWLRVT